MSWKSITKNILGSPIFNNKEYLNAVITSDPDYKLDSKSKHAAYRLSMIIYATIIFVATAVSLSMLLISTKIQQKYAASFSIIEVVVFITLLIDFSLRWYTAPTRMKKGSLSFLLFPISITGVLLIASLLPSMYLINVWTGKDIKIFETFEAMKFLRIFRVILLANFIPGLSLFKKVLIKERQTLYTVFALVIVTIFTFTLVIYNVELNKGKDPQVKSFFDALYFSTVTLTTIGFGDISPSTTTGRVIVMVMAILGLAILSIPSGVIAGGFISELKLVREEKEKSKEEKYFKEPTKTKIIENKTKPLSLDNVTKVGIIASSKNQKKKKLKEKQRIEKIQNKKRARNKKMQNKKNGNKEN